MDPMGYRFPYRFPPSFGGFFWAKKSRENQLKARQPWRFFDTVGNLDRPQSSMLRRSGFGFAYLTTGSGMGFQGRSMNI